MANGSTSSASNPPRATSETKSKKKKSSTGKALILPTPDTNKSTSGRNSPHTENGEGQEGSAEKEHIRELLK
jgi:hypothetical protein